MKKIFGLRVSKMTKNEIYFFHTNFLDLDDFYYELEKILARKRFKGTVYFDRLSVSLDENWEYRFTKFRFENKKFVRESLEYVHFDKDSEFRIKTSEYFRSTLGTTSEVFIIKDMRDKLANNEIL